MTAISDFIGVCNFITIDNNADSLLCYQLNKKGWNGLFFNAIFYVVVFFFSHWLPALLNYHCEHELWKAGLHNIADGLILSFHIGNNFVPEKLPKLYKMFVQKKAIHYLYEKKIYMYMCYEDFFFFQCYISKW